MNPAPGEQSAEDVATINAIQGRSKASFPRLQYTAPPLGVNPAYDEALKFLAEDRESIRAKINSVRNMLQRVKGDESVGARDRRRDWQTRLDALLVQRDINSPEVQWRAKNDDMDLNLPVYRHLAKRKWSERALLLTMQRVEQMHVVPDVIPRIKPSVDVRLTFAADDKPGSKAFETGAFVASSQTEKMPEIEVQLFDEYVDRHARYSIAIVDPDVPDDAADSFTSYLHYLQTDVELSPTQPSVGADNGTVRVGWVPPHPHKGTPYHRYTCLVWAQSSKTVEAGDVARLGFKAQAFAQRNGLHPIGINFWRQVYDENVSAMMQRYPDVGYLDKDYRRVKA